MADNNPFSSYTTDDQNYIADGLRTAATSGKLNPAQMQGVQSALKYLPMSKQAAADSIDKTMSLGMAPWRPQQGTKFSDVMYVDPQSKISGGDLGAMHGLAGTGLVDTRDVAQARSNIKTSQTLRAKQAQTSMGAPEEGDSTGGQLMEGLSHTSDMMGQLGGSLASAPFKQGSTAQGISRGVGSFVGSVAGDPTNLALAGMGSEFGIANKIMGAGFAGIAAKGTYDAASELHDVWNRDDIPHDRKVELGTNMTLNALMAGLAGTHTVKSFLDNTALPASDKATIQQRIEATHSQAEDGTLTPRPSAPLVSATGVFDADNKIAPKPVERTPLQTIAPETTVTSSSLAKADTDHYAAAKAEWMEKNPGQTPDNGTSWIARRANELKTGVADPTLQPSASKTPVTEQAKAELSPAEKAKLLTPDRNGVTDLRTVDADTRHEWMNQKSMNIELAKGKTAADALREARTIFGPERKLTINSFIDKDSTLHHGLQLFKDSSGAPAMHPSPANAEDVSDLSTGGQKLFQNIQDAEGKFNERTGGKHVELLKQLWDATSKTLPDAPREAKLALYGKGIDALNEASLGAKSASDFSKAFDIVTKKSEGGFAAIGGKQRISDAQAQAVAKIHADTTIGRWETLTDAALKGRKAEAKLTDPALRNSVQNSGDASLQARYAALLDRSNKLRASDPIAVLGHTLDGHSITESDITKGSLRENLGVAAHDNEMRMKALQSYRDEWKTRPINDTIKFIDAVENGDLASIENPRDYAMAGKLRQLLDTKREDIRNLGRAQMQTRINEYNSQIGNAKSTEQAKMWTAERNYMQSQLDTGHTSLLDSFNENYFPHLWRYGVKDIAANLMQGRRPFAPRSFLKQRTYASFTEGIADGMEPVTYNPVDMTLMKLHEMDRFSTAHRTFNDLKEMGLAHILSPDQVPDGWTKVNDNMFNAGQNAAWYMPKEAAGPMNRYLSPGLRGNFAYDTIAHYNNLVNQFNLGLSGFHAIETGVNASVSRAALGLVKLSRLSEFPKNLSGLKDIALSPIAPFQAAMEGRKVAANYLDPARFMEYNDTANAVATAGGRVKMPSEYSNQAGEAFRSAWKETAFAAQNGLPGRVISKAALGTYRSIGALMEQLNKPIMEQYVPSTKLGVFHWMAQDILDRLPENTSHEVLRKELGYAWDRVDDRFGQVVYDNLFWNRMAKDVSHLMIRSVGWNYGDVRELGGALWDLRDKESLKAAVTGKGITQKQGYVLGLLGYTAMMGYTLNHFYGQKVDNPVDLMYPKNGKLNPDGSPQRIYLKTYVHDAYNFYHAPGETATNKLAPVWHQMSEMYKNADYYGTQIHPIHANTTDAILDPKTYTDSTKYLVDQAAPFSVRNYQQRRQQGESIPSALSSSAAILPAPKWVGQSKAELLAYELFKTKLGQGPSDPMKTESVRRYHELASGFAANRYTGKDVAAAFKNGEITAKQMDGILDENEGQLSPLQRHVKQLEPHEFLRIWQAANPQEKTALTDDFFKRWDSLDEKYPAPIAEQLQKRFTSEWKTFQQSKKSN